MQWVRCTLAILSRWRDAPGAVAANFEPSQEDKPLTRFRNLILFAAVAALAVGLVACGGDDGGGENPRQVLEGATLKGVESGNLDLSLSVKAEGDGGADLDIAVSGPFQGRGDEQLPLFDMTAKVTGTADGDDVDFEGGVILSRDAGYVSYSGSAYQVEKSMFDGLQSLFGQAAQQSSSDQSAGDGVDAACRKKVEQLQVSDFLSNLSNDGTEEVGGVETTHISGDLDVEKGIDTVVDLAGDPACQGQLGSTPVPPVGAIDQVRDAVKSASIDLYVGNDGIIRRVSGSVSVEPQEGSGDGPSSADLTFDLTLSNVNQAQVIRAPANAKPLDQLLGQLGVDPSALDALGGLGALQGLGGGLPGGLGGGGGNAVVPGAADVPGIDSGTQQEYLDCLQGATTPVDLQNCAQQNSN